MKRGLFNLYNQGRGEEFPLPDISWLGLETLHQVQQRKTQLRQLARQIADYVSRQAMSERQSQIFCKQVFYCLLNSGQYYPLEIVYFFEKLTLVLKSYSYHEQARHLLMRALHAVSDPVAQICYEDIYFYFLQRWWKKNHPLYTYQLPAVDISIYRSVLSESQYRAVVSLLNQAVDTESFQQHLDDLFNQWFGSTNVSQTFEKKSSAIAVNRKIRAKVRSSSWWSTLCYFLLLVSTPVRAQANDETTLTLLQHDNYLDFFLNRYLPLSNDTALVFGQGRMNTTDYRGLVAGGIYYSSNQTLTPLQGQAIVPTVQTSVIIWDLVQVSQKVYLTVIGENTERNTMLVTATPTVSFVWQRTFYCPADGGYTHNYLRQGAAITDGINRFDVGECHTGSDHKIVFLKRASSQQSAEYATEIYVLEPNELDYSMESVPHGSLSANNQVIINISIVGPSAYQRAYLFWLNRDNGSIQQIRIFSLENGDAGSVSTFTIYDMQYTPEGNNICMGIVSGIPTGAGGLFATCFDSNLGKQWGYVFTMGPMLNSSYRHLSLINDRGEFLMAGTYRGNGTYLLFVRINHQTGAIIEKRLFSLNLSLLPVLAPKGIAERAGNAVITGIVKRPGNDILSFILEITPTPQGNLTNCPYLTEVSSDLVTAVEVSPLLQSNIGADRTDVFATRPITMGISTPRFPLVEAGASEAVKEGECSSSESTGSSGPISSTSDVTTLDPNTAFPLPRFRSGSGGLVYLWFLLPGGLLLALLLSALLYYYRKKCRAGSLQLIPPPVPNPIPLVNEGSSFAVLMQLLRGVNANYRDLSLSQPELQPNEELEQLVRSYLFSERVGNSSLAEKFILNDQRKNTFYSSYENLPELCSRLRMDDYIDSARLLLNHKHSLFFQGSNSDIIKQILQGKHSFSLKEAVKGLLQYVNAFLVTQGHNTSIEYKDLLRANHLILWEQPVKGLITLVDMGEHYLVQVDLPSSPLTLEQLQSFQDISYDPPQWFRQLPDWEKHYWRHRLLDAQGQIIPQALQELAGLTQPSLLRCYPGLPNLMTHHCLVYDKSGHLLLHTQSSRSGTVDAYKVSDTSSRSALVDVNLLQLLMNELPKVLMQRMSEIGRYYAFISEHRPVLYVPVLFQTLLAEFGAEGAMDQCKTTALGDLNYVVSRLQNRDDKVQLVLLESNYPLNKVGRFFSSRLSMEEKQQFVRQLLVCLISQLELLRYGQGLSDEKNQQIKNLIDYLEPFHRAESDIASLDMNTRHYLQDFLSIRFRAELDTKLHVLFKLFDQYVRMQFRFTGKKGNSYWGQLAALEKNIVKLLGGLAYLTCKSGKDRTGILLITEDVDLFLAFTALQLEGEGDINAKQRADFFVKVFLSGHQQWLASLSASGCTAIKSMKYIVFSRVLKLLKEQKFDFVFNERCADSNNEYKGNKLPVKDDQNIADSAEALRLRGSREESVLRREGLFARGSAADARPSGKEGKEEESDSEGGFSLA